MSHFEHVRHRPPLHLAKSRELLLVVCPLRSTVNLSRMVRLAGCAGIKKIVYEGRAKIDATIARDAKASVQIESHRSLPPFLPKLRQANYQLVGLEQTTNSTLLYEHQFQRRTALVVGSERAGLTQPVLDLLDAVVEIPVYGLPASYNVVTATTMAIYEYCRQFPDG